MSFEVKLDKFEGPLDLLLHLIRKNEMDIYDIPMVEVTTQYLAILDAMQTLNLDIAGEFLVMAATLIHIKSRILLPQAEDEPSEEDEEDPRAELVRRLLEYQKYKDAGANLDAFPQLERDVFARSGGLPELTSEGSEELEPVGIYELFELFRELLQAHPEETFHDVDVEQLSVTERINSLLTRLSGQSSLAFTELFEGRPNRADLVVTLLAVLELVKLRMLRLMQESRYGAIWLFPAVPAEGEELVPASAQEALLGYQ